MNKNQSIATIDSPEFINLYPLDINPLMSACNIKVLYLGENRNGSFISKDVAIEMAKTLRGCPIVGYWREEKNDFGGHGEVLTVDENGEIQFACKTVPYGFVSPVADIWFQKFNDTDVFGNIVEREYLVTQGFLWTGQFEEANSALDGHGQSMELDGSTIEGSWATNNKTGMDFFIINDATFTKLCILGDDVEPCFEGASIKGTTVDYSEEQSFAFALRSMLKELNETLYSEGGLVMPEDFVATNESNSAEVVEEIVEEVVESEEVKEETLELESEPEEETGKIESENKEIVSDTVVTDELAADEAPADEPAAEEVVDEIVETFSLSQEELQELEELRAFKLEHEKELEELRAFKLAQENEAKDEMINKYHMLTNEDKAEIIEHKAEYTLQQIEEKLALVYVNKNVDFSTVDGLPEKEEIDNSFTFSLDSSVNETADVDDAILNALRELKD